MFGRGTGSGNGAGTWKSEMIAIDIVSGLGEPALRGHLEIFYTEIEKIASMNHVRIFRLIVGKAWAMPLPPPSFCVERCHVFRLPNANDKGDLGFDS
jgi:hypothetical protein